MEFFFKGETLQNIATTEADKYQSADPFPHIVIDDFLPIEVADAVLSDFPEGSNSTWMHRPNCCNHGNNMKIYKIFR